MNPKSRMVLFAVALLSGSVSARAVELWKEVKTPQGTFYAPKAEFDRLAGASTISGDSFLFTYPGDAAKKDPKAWPRWKLFKHYGADNPACPAFVKERLAKPPKGVAPELLRLVIYDLNAAPSKPSASKLWVTAAKDMDPKDYRKPGTAPAASRPEPAQKPEGVDQDVWNLLKAAGQATAQNAEVLQRIKKGGATKDAYAKIAAGGAKYINPLVRQIGLVTKGKTLGADQIYAELISTAGGKKSPLMTALEQGAAPVKPGHAPATVEGKPVGGEPGKEKAGSQLFIDALIELLGKNPQVAPDMAKRIAKYILEDEGKAFLSAETRKDPKLEEGVNKAVLAWVDSLKGTKPALVAEVYYVLGSGGGAPSWSDVKPGLGNALADEQAKRTLLFKEGMRVWTQTAPDTHGAAQCADTDVPGWLGRFLGGDKSADADPVSAVNVAHAVLANPSVMSDLPGLAERLAANAQNGVVAGGLGGPAIKGVAKGYSFDDLYGKGGLVNPEVMAPGDPVSRKISIKIVTVRDGDRLVDKIAVFDITNPSDAFGQKFDINTAAGKTTRPLDDRAKGYPDYVFATTPKGNDTVITFGRAGNESQMSITLRELYQARARQAVDLGDIRTVGSKQFYVMGQGGKNGSLLFFPSDLEARMQANGVLSPDMVSDVAQRQGAYTLNNTGKIQLGVVDGAKYHMEYDPALGYWDAKPGDWDHPVPATPPGGAATGPTGDAAPATGPTPSDIPDMDAAMTRDGYELDSAITNALAKDFQPIYRFYISKENRPFNQRHYLVVPESISDQKRLLLPVPPTKNDEKRADELRVIAQQYVAASEPTGNTFYYNLNKPQKYEVGADKMIKTLPFAYDAVKEKIISISTGVLLDDAMTRIGFTEAERLKAKQNLAHLLTGKADAEYLITGGVDSSGKSLFLAFKGANGSTKFYPEVQAGPSTPVDQNTQGPGFAFDMQKEPVAEPLAANASGNYGTPQQAQMEDIYQVQLSTQKNAALYANNKDQKKATRWYLMYKFETKAEGSMRSKNYIMVFSKNVQEDRKSQPSVQPYPEGKAIDLSGLAAPEYPQSGTVVLYKDGQNGVWYAVKKSGLSKDNAPELQKNCVGPLIWWGMKGSDALNACREGKTN